MINAQQRNLSIDPKFHPAAMAVDLAPTQFRKVIRRLADNERAQVDYEGAVKL